MERSDWLVVAQGLALAAILWPRRAAWPLIPAARAVARGTAAAGGALALAGAWPHGRRLTPHVNPPDGAELLTEGAYRVSRHPIYAGLLLAAGGVAVLRRNARSLGAWAGLAAVLAAKTRLEERRLTDRFGQSYRQYAARTHRLLGRPSAL